MEREQCIPVGSKTLTSNRNVMFSPLNKCYSQANNYLASCADGNQLVSSYDLDVVDTSSYVRLWSFYEDSERRLLILLCRNESNKKGKERGVLFSRLI
jgi:hypothetical protein